MILVEDELPDGKDATKEDNSDPEDDCTATGGDDTKTNDTCDPPRSDCYAAFGDDANTGDTELKGEGTLATSAAFTQAEPNDCAPSAAVGLNSAGKYGHW